VPTASSLRGRHVSRAAGKQQPDKRAPAAPLPKASLPKQPYRRTQISGSRVLTDQRRPHTSPRLEYGSSRLRITNGSDPLDFRWAYYCRTGLTGLAESRCRAGGQPLLSGIWHVACVYCIRKKQRE